MAEQRTVTITIEQAAQRLGIGRSLAYEAARSGEIPTIRIGRRILVPTAALDRLLSLGNSDVAPKPIAPKK